MPSIDAERAAKHAFMANGIAYAVFGYCVAEGYTFPGMGLLLLSPMASTWLLEPSRPKIKHELIGGLTPAVVALIPTFSKSLKYAVDHSLLGNLLAQSLQMFVLLSACSFMAHGCGMALGELWPIRLHAVSRARQISKPRPRRATRSWKALAEFSRAIEPIVPIVQAALPRIERVLVLVVLCVAYLLHRCSSN